MSEVRNISLNFSCIKGTREIKDYAGTTIMVATIFAVVFVSVGIRMWTIDRAFAIGLLVPGSVVFAVGVPLGIISIFRARSIDKANKDALKHSKFLTPTVL